MRTLSWFIRQLHSNRKKWLCRRLGNDGSDYFNDYSERYFVVIAIAVVVAIVVVVTAVYALGLPQCLPATIAMERERERECMNTRLAHRRVPLIALTITGVAKSENIYCLRLHSVSVRWTQSDWIDVSPVNRIMQNLIAGNGVLMG